nr:MAG TPA: Protein of unknown function (DUF1642) [Caudoviricetes sp.]
MGDWTKVLIYGTFDGFTFSTDELTRINVVLVSGEIVEVPEDFVVSADQMVNKHKIKLKDVIARIENFDLATKAVWINEILYKLGSDYGLHKYYAGYKQGKLEGLIECEKVTITQDIADYIEYAKENDWDLQDAMNLIVDEEDGNLSDWFYKDKNMETLALAWINGYIVKEEKRYLVKIKDIEGDNCYLNRVISKWIIAGSDDHPVLDIYTHHTRKELEDAGFGEVFNCPLFEIEEVEE